MLHLLEVAVIAAAVVFITFLILLALPSCKIRDMLMPFVAWAFVALCAAYTISPVDILPEVVMGPLGLFDDAGAIIAGVGTAVKMIRAKKEKESARHDPYFN